MIGWRLLVHVVPSASRSCVGKGARLAGQEAVSRASGVWCGECRRISLRALWSQSIRDHRCASDATVRLS